MTATDADRAKAAAAMGWGGIGDEYLTGMEIKQRDAIAAALAAERAAAVTDLRARIEAVAEEWEANGGWDLDYAARLRAAVTDTTGGTQ